MSKYVPSWFFKTEWDGDTIQVKLRPLERGDIMCLTELPRNNGKVDDQAFVAEIGKLLPKYIDGGDKGFFGLSDASGQPVPLEVVIRDSYFTGLLARIGNELVKKAVPDFMKPGSSVAEPSAASPSTSTPESVASVSAVG